jgi:hypothetical protein
LRCYTLWCISEDLSEQEIGVDLLDLHFNLREGNGFFIRGD